MTTKTLKISQAEMLEALQYYFDERVYRPTARHRVVSVAKDGYGDHPDFSIELEQVGPEAEKPEVAAEGGAP